MFADRSNPPVMRRLPAQARGFSLVEVLVSFVILGLLLVAGVPSMTAWMRNAQIRNAAESITNGLNRARMEAVRRNSAVMFSLVSTNTSNALDSTCALSSSSPSWVISLTSPAGRCDVAASDTTAPQTIEKWAKNDGSLKASITAYSDTACGTAATTPQVSFDGYGRVATGAGLRCMVITHSNSSTDNRPLRVIINGSNVRMCDPATALAATDPRRC